MLKNFNDLQTKVKDLTNENQILHQKNQFVYKHYEDLKAKFDETVELNQKLEKFKPGYLKLQEKFPNYSVDKLIDKFDYLESMNMNFIKKIGEFEDEKIQTEFQNKKNNQKHIEKLQEMDRKNYENTRYIENLRHQIHTQESEHAQENYKSSYFTLFNKILHIFNLYANKIPVYFYQKDTEQPKANMEDPIEMLELLEKLIGISNKTDLVSYLRRIIISANVLQRKFFPEYVNDKFDPDKIYERISNLIQQLKGDIIKQKTEINNLRVALEKEKSKMSLKCEEKAKESRKIKSAKKDIEEKEKEIHRRNAFL